ncbi:hypothetical protein AC249_AIPGENE16919 [Exaiptasia diaphana]|nr:hypothetical protein AC249_AIPGENE16919 [Exaiptasia diaphana]
MGSLQGSRKNRNDSIERCYQDAVKGGFTMFGLQHGGECWTGDKLEKTYSKHGEADNCKDGLGGVWSNDVYSINFYRKGCYKDDSPRTMGVFLGSFTGPNAVLRCYQLVKDRKHSAFGVQNGGDCYTSYDAMAVYDKYGAGSDCKDGKGGPSSNDVYFINRFDKNDKLYPREGCFKDKRDRALPVYLGYFHKNAVNSCFRAALAKDWRFFGIQNGGECWSGPNVIATFSKHGAGTKCHNGLGGVWNTDVYRIAFQHKDCYVDDPLRALPDVLGIWRKVSPSVILAKCFEAAKAKGLKVFGIQYDGECYSSPNGLSTYKKYGPGTGCTDGVGENWVNDVYSVDSTSQYTSLGCWKDRPWRRFELLGTWKEDVYRKCYEAVTARGWKGFGIQYGGECWSNKDIETLYNVRGKSTDCKDGRGGEWANNIYLV